MSKGRHSAAPTGALVRDLAVMAFLFVAAGTLAFGVIWWLQSRGDDNPPGTTIASETTLPSGVIGSIPPGTDPTIATTAPPTATATTEAPVRDPSEVRVLVLNAIGRQGIAGELTSLLEEAGYQVGTPDNYSGSVDTSKIWYAEGFQREALELASFVPDGLPELNPDTATNTDFDIVVVLGPTYEG